MIVTKGISFKRLLKWSGHHVIWLLLLMGTIAALYHLEILNFYIPWLPVSVVGTAVAFYVGFKNNQAYDRMWEARKVWGGIVNESRSWGMLVQGYITNLFAEQKLKDDELAQIKKKFTYRHIAWLYAHRKQLLVPTEWEHISQGGHTARYARFYQERFGVGLIDDENASIEPEHFLMDDDEGPTKKYANQTTQILNRQSLELSKIRELGLIDDFRHVELTRLLQNFCDLQGKNERLKKFPLPRQYANMSRYFVGIFIMLLPFSMIPELMKIGNWGLWLSIPITALIGWLYVMMEVVGDYSENPFQGMANDIPMMSLCRTIEIDLREMLGETDLPPVIKSKDGVLM
ncbi:MAG: hypothetical protein H6605_07120 [Flavobacteriales bacterium]|nr:hypothetical protein [Flavobacteriales bacterium]